ncbi:MAG: signal peptidase II [Candidatus Komeilibacteria bacterium]|nr:signal peptidase II [Candidatus Komeilibacteria bacterium]
MRFRTWLLVAIFIVDRFVKSTMWFTPPQGIVARFLHPVLNQDIAFSISIPFLQQGALRALVIVLTLTVFYVAFREFKKKNFQFFWWGLIGIGALSNMLDRITLGGVLDYIDVGFWPVFNLSDTAIVTGIVVLIFFEFRSKKIILSRN